MILNGTYASKYNMIEEALFCHSTLPIRWPTCILQTISL